MITDNFISELEQIVGKEHVSVSPANAELYSYDASLARGKPGVVVFPADGNQVARFQINDVFFDDHANMAI